MIRFAKGHGTENDFLILPDPDAALELTPHLVAALCERRAGLGADGVLRVARAGALARAGVLPGLPAGVAAGDWFMDYRNADGSVAEMCGNGVRVFAHHLVSRGLAAGPRVRVGTRAGLRPVRVLAADRTRAEVRVDMGRVGVLGVAAAHLNGARYAGIGVDVGNPHLACVLPGLTAGELAGLELAGAPEFPEAMFPAGANLEILTPLAGDAVSMRVVERGAGETRSCGTGTVAAAAAALADAGRVAGEVSVRVPGGVVRVGIGAGGAAELTGPSVILAEGEVDPAALG